MQNNQQTNGYETRKTVSEPEIQETGFYEGDPVLFFPITNSTRRNICQFFGLLDVNSVMRQMPNYKLGGTGQGLKPPKKFRDKGGQKLLLQSHVFHFNWGGKTPFCSMTSNM